MTLSLRHRVTGVAVAAVVAMLSVFSGAGPAHAATGPALNLKLTDDFLEPVKRPIAVGDTVHMKLTPVNIGDVTLTDIVVSVAQSFASGPEPTVSCPQTALDPGESMDCTAEYTLLDADGDRGYTAIQFTAHGVDGAGGEASDENWFISLSGANDLTWTVTSDAKDQLINPEGDTVHYSITVTNAGTRDWKEVKVSVDREVVTCDGDTLPSGGKLTCTAADLASGKITNTIGATGLVVDAALPDILKNTRLSSNLVSYELHAPMTPGVRFLSASVDKAAAKPGDKLTYTFTIQNSGNASLSDLKVAVAKATGAGTAPDLAKAACTQDGAKVDLATLELGYGDKVTCTVTYVVVDKDVKTGTIAYQVTVSAQPRSADTDPVRVSATSQSVETKVTGKSVAPTGGMTVAGPSAAAGTAGTLVLLAGWSMLVVGLRRRNAA